MERSDVGGREGPGHGSHSPPTRRAFSKADRSDQLGDPAMSSDGGIPTRFSSVDFFAVLMPGFYIFCSLCFAAFGLGFWHDPSIVRGLILPDREAPQSWAFIFVVAIASYLCGSVVRAFPVGLTDDVTNGLFYGKRAYLAFMNCLEP